MGRKNRNSELDWLKYEVSSELGYIPQSSGDFNFEISGELGIPSNFSTHQAASQNYTNYLNQTKFEVANELGIPLKMGDNGDLLSRDAGRIGGRVGGKIGGNMVRKMVEYAENHMKTNGGQL